MMEAKKLHAQIITKGLQHQETYLRKLITSILAISNNNSNYDIKLINYARIVFDHIGSPSTFTYNTMIKAYSTSPYPRQALHIYSQMHKLGIPPDNYTFPFLLKACASLLDLRKGEETHCQVIKHGLGYDVYVHNSLIHFYGCIGRIDIAYKIFDETGIGDIASWTTLVTCSANSGSLELARETFEKMPERTAVSFSAMVTAYVRHGRFKEALNMFRDLQVAGVEPNDSTIMGVLCSCANLGALDTGRWIHSYVKKQKGTSFDVRITTALIDMYFKCGSVSNAVDVFAGAKEKNVAVWTAMIHGMSTHGLGYKSVELFEDMVRLGIKPNVVTFVALLSGCTHAGLVDKGLRYYEKMKSEFGIAPTIEHYGCVVDLLGRAGLIREAVEFINQMPMQANAAVLGSLLNACRVHRNVEIGEFIVRLLIKEEPLNGALYMSLLSLYGEACRWDDVKKVKGEMKKVGCRKIPGCSLIEVNGVCYEFISGDKSYQAISELCLRLALLGTAIEEECNERFF
ncbi:hypothetical protein Scep_003952 [Stephania cephalantha]|uniref:Pentatricopeptide repeat-containing protein n=1 Tax=Stephania cephalantha TaxID=152367 RepID=A0AAP0KRH7_9MAGN